MKNEMEKLEIKHVLRDEDGCYSFVDQWHRVWEKRWDRIEEGFFWEVTEEFPFTAEDARLRQK